jgi:hypothetical protein
VLGAGDLLSALRDQGVRLSRAEEGRLLDALETQDSGTGATATGSSGGGGVAYRELLGFCAKHAGKWTDAHQGACLFVCVNVCMHCVCTQCVLCVAVCAVCF